MNIHYELHIAGSLKFAALNVLKKLNAEKNCS